MPIADNGEVRIHYESSGEGNRDLLVLGNSLGSNLNMWNKVTPRFRQRHRVLRYDMRGHGASSVPVGTYTLDQLGRDVLFLLDSIGVERVNFCGLSLGGQVAMWLATHETRRVSRIILANTGACIGTPEMWDARVATVERNGMDALATATLERWFTPQYRKRHADEMAIVRNMIASTDPVGYIGCCGVLRDADLTTEIASARTPCLVITGTHDPATPPAYGRALCAAIPGSAYVELDASHLSAWERAEEFADAVLAFLDTGGRGNG
jgi:3-oxoadipate enol-lactonase